MEGRSLFIAFLGALAITILIATALIGFFRHAINVGEEIMQLEASSFLRNHLQRYRASSDYMEITLEETRSLFHEIFYMPNYIADGMPESFWRVLTQLVECFCALGPEPAVNAKLCAGCLTGMAKGQEEYEPLDVYYWLECTHDEETWIVQVARHLRSDEYYYLCIDNADDVRGSSDSIDLSYSYREAYQFLLKVRQDNKNRQK